MKLRGKRPTSLLAGQSQTSSLAPPVRQIRGVKTWGQGPYEQGFLPLLRGYGGSHFRLAILPGSDLFMANRYAKVIPPPFVHGYGAKGKNILPQWESVVRLPTLPESVWGNGDTVPLWASVGKKGSGPVRLQLFPGVLMFWKKDALSSCRATPKWRSRPNNWAACSSCCRCACLAGPGGSAVASLCCRHKGHAVGPQSILG